MSNDTSTLIGVVVVAFIVGYEAVNFIIKKVKSREQTPDSDNAYMGLSEDVTDDSRITEGPNTEGETDGDNQQQAQTAHRDWGI